MLNFLTYLASNNTPYRVFKMNMLPTIEKHWALLTGCLFFIITGLSLSPLDSLPSAPGSDKIHHLIAYAALVFPVALRQPNRWLWFVVFFIGYSGLIELIQPYVNRYGEWQDMLANTAGVVCGVALATAINAVRNRRLKD
jgi:VanZ family protein